MVAYTQEPCPARHRTTVLFNEIAAAVAAMTRASGTGGSNPPLSASESQERLSEPGPAGRVLVSTGASMVTFW